jgi:DNA-binding CsgD family transcriptional regulator
LLIGLFRFGPLEAVIVNKAMSLIVVASALPLRTGTISFAAIAEQWMVIANLLAGSLLGAWVGAAWATRLRSETLYRVIAVLLVAIAVVLLVGHGAEGSGRPVLTGTAQTVRAVASGQSVLDPAVTARVLAAYRTSPSAEERPVDIDELTSREVDVLRLMARGLTNGEIAAELVISEVTVKSHIGRIFTKLDLRDRAAAIIYAFDHGLATPSAG